MPLEAPVMMIDLLSRSMVDPHSTILLLADTAVRIFLRPGSCAWPIRIMRMADPDHALIGLDVILLRTLSERPERRA